MRLITVLLVIFTRLFNVENRMFRHNNMRSVVTEQVPEPTPPLPLLNFAVSPEPEPTSENDEYEQETVTIKDTENEENREEYEYNYDYAQHQKELLQKLKEPCAIVVFSNIQSPTMQSLIRKYKYDAQGALIPSSVKYFMKVPQGYGPPLLVPLNYKSFSHLGGFVRYYKEVPPIPLAY